MNPTPIPATHWPVVLTGHPWRLAIWLLLLGAASGNADWLWKDFEAADPEPEAVQGVLGWVVPAPWQGQTRHHVASIGRPSPGLGGTGRTLRLSFVNDGNRFPSTGVGLQFPQAQTKDLRASTGLRMRIRSDRSRPVWIALDTRLDGYRPLADSGVSLGWEVWAGTAEQVVHLPMSALAYPSWATRTPPLAPVQVQSAVTAIQIFVACTQHSGVCNQEAGWLEVDQIEITGMGGSWTSPVEGQCDEDRVINLSTPHPFLVGRNRVGGWWYAYDDRGGSDPLARGLSEITNAPDPSRASTWSLASDGVQDHQTRMAFRLQRGGPHSGFAGLETQLREPGPHGASPIDLWGLGAVSFELTFEDGWPVRDVPGVVLHIRRVGQDFTNGQNHQVRIPWNASTRRWCLPTWIFEQPRWADRRMPFLPEQLLALGWEAKLESALAEAVGAFRISNVRLHGVDSTTWGPDVGVGDRIQKSVAPVRYAEKWRLQWPILPGDPLDAVISWLDVSGRIRLRHSVPHSGEAVVEAPWNGMGWVQIEVAGRVRGLWPVVALP